MGEVTALPSVSGGPRLRPPEPLSDSHDATTFDCGKVELDKWIKKKARAGEGLTARTYVVCDGNKIIGYYCIAAGSIERGELPKKHQRDTPNSIPIAIIGRLAVDTNYQRSGIGKGLLKDAILRILSVSGQLGVRAIVVHAIDNTVMEFYRKVGFRDSPLNVRTLILPIETAKAALP
jgi:GNAT superfamily N-acetyltransferase